jgi:hypothetical protein
MENAKKQEKRFSVRFPVDILEDMRKIADEEERSLNTEIVRACRDRIARQKKLEKSQEADPDG